MARDMGMAMRNTPVVILTLENFNKTKDVVKVSLSIKMETYTKVNGKMIVKMDLESLDGHQVLNISVNGTKTGNRANAYTILQMEYAMKESGSTRRNTALEPCSILMEPILQAYFGMV